MAVDPGAFSESHRPSGLTVASLVDLDPELFEGLDPAARAVARRHTVVRILALEPGASRPAGLGGPGGPFAALVARGLLVSEVVLGATAAAELIGPGDVVDLASSEGDLLPAAHRWAVAEPVTLALLDARLMPALRAWPSLAAALTSRAAARAQRVEVQRAISQLPRIEERLIAFFGHLAERFGRVALEGVVIPLALTRQMLGRLVGARRPTVSLALKDLAEAGTLVRRPDGAWLLSPAGLAGLQATSDIAPPRAGDAMSVVELPAPVRVPHRITTADLERLV